MAKGKGTKLIAQNKKAYHDYFIEETIQAGISLAGTEVKSLRMGKCSLKESYIQIKDGEASMIEADCPDQICVHEKAISADGESIICLPNKIVVEVESDKESELDAVMK